MNAVDGIEIRESVADDVSAVATIYPGAFPDEDLVPLVRDLLREKAGVLSLVATNGGTVVGHAVFTMGEVEGADAAVALLGPLCVDAARHRQGIGGAIVRAGLHRLEGAGVTSVFVLGDPAYYGRFGFMPEPRVLPPYQLPPEWTDAWQSLALRQAELPLQGTLKLPEVWMQPALWTT